MQTLSIMTPIFNQECRPEISAIRPLRDDLAEALNEYLTDKDIQTVQLVLSEWITNLVEHASHVADNILIRAEHDEAQGMLAFSVVDDGSYFSEFEQKLKQLSDTLDVEKLDTGGMGLYLLREHFPKVKYERKDEKNILSFTLENLAAEFGSTSVSTILVVEDVQPMALLIRKMFGEEYNVLLAYNAQEAKGILQSQSIDLVLCDIGLPDVDGITLRQQIEQDTALRAIPFVFLTANENSTIEQQAYDLGVDDYLPKPIEKEKLLNTVHRVLQRNQQLTHSIGEKLDAEATDRMIPHCPSNVAGYEAELLFKEASAGGGDMVLHFKRSQDELLLLADVTGHGTKAKYFAHLYGGYLYGLLKHMDSVEPPEVLMARLSDMIDADPYLAGNFITCQIVSLRKEVISIASAGHPPPILLDKGGAKLMPIEGALPGLLAGTVYESYSLTLSKNQAVLLYSDGLTEGNRDPQAQQQFDKWLKNSTSSLSTDNLWSGYTQHFGEVLYDDVTALIIRH